MHPRSKSDVTTDSNSNNHSAVILGLSFCAGIGLTLMILALAIGVIEAEAADNQLMLLLFVGGLVAFIAGVVGWFGVVQPHRHFDDINIPAPDEHHHDEHAIVEHDDAGTVQEHPAH